MIKKIKENVKDTEEKKNLKIKGLFIKERTDLFDSFLIDHEKVDTQHFVDKYIKDNELSKLLNKKYYGSEG
jgi:hypothetical protein